MPEPHDDGGGNRPELPARLQLARLARRDRRLDAGCGAAPGLGMAFLVLSPMMPLPWPLAMGVLLLATAICGVLGRLYGGRFFDKVVDVLAWW